VAGDTIEEAARAERRGRLTAGVALVLCGTVTCVIGWLLAIAVHVEPTPGSETPIAIGRTLWHPSILRTSADWAGLAVVMVLGLCSLLCFVIASVSIWRSRLSAYLGGVATFLAVALCVFLVLPWLVAAAAPTPRSPHPPGADLRRVPPMLSPTTAQLPPHAATRG
jgi:hypothetical protein